MDKGKMLRKLTEKAGLYAEAIPGVPLLELCGEDRVLIENHISVAGYTENEVLIRVCYGLLQIKGESLILTKVNKEMLLICGGIVSIEIIK